MLNVKIYKHFLFLGLHRQQFVGFLAILLLIYFFCFFLSPINFQREGLPWKILTQDITVVYHVKLTYLNQASQSKVKLNVIQCFPYHNIKHNKQDRGKLVLTILSVTIMIFFKYAWKVHSRKISKRISIILCFSGDNWLANLRDCS